MGVEYQHFLVVNDPTWRPNADTAARVEAVLRRWLLGDAPMQVVNLPTREWDDSRIYGRKTPASGQPRTAVVQPGPRAGVGFVFNGVRGETVARLAGPSAYYGDDRPDERYIMRVILVVGDDFRIQKSHEGASFIVETPPIANGVPIPEYDDEDPLCYAYARSYRADEATSPPVVSTIIEEHFEGHVGWRDFQGFWRGGLMIDFGKDLPTFSEEVHLLPAHGFVKEIAEAFRGPIVELGEFN